MSTLILCGLLFFSGCSGDSDDSKSSVSSLSSVNSSSSAPSNPGSIVINEAAATNDIELDEDGDAHDWFELYNPTSTPISLSGWTITDDENVPDKWVFPELVIDSGEYLRVWASDKDRRQNQTYRTLVAPGARFDYQVPNENTASDWTDSDTLSELWMTGPSGIGYGDGDDATELRVADAVSVFMRTEFTLADPQTVMGLILHIDFDDGFAAYINGVEIARDNLPINPQFDTLASSEHEASLSTTSMLPSYPVTLEPDLLREGVNIFAVQVHNSSATSSDLTALPILTAAIRGSSEIGETPPSRLGLPELNLHTNFKLTSEGESLFLFDAEQVLVDSLDVPPVPLNASYGLSQSDLTPSIFLVPTPGSANTSKAYQGVSSSQLSFSHPGGPMSPGTVLIDGAAADEIVRYTTDGSEPTESSQAYDGPLTISEDTVLRARAFHSTKAPSPIVSRAFLPSAQHQLPVVSLITDPLNFFDMEFGIYVLGPNYEPQNPYYGANFWQDWERPIHFSFYESNGELATELDAGVKVFGGWSRAHAQKSLAIYARSRYGVGKIDYPLFPSRPYQEFEAIVLRNSGNDWLSTMLRDAAMTGLMDGSGLDVQGYRPTVVYLNGEYWGIHNLREKVNEHFLASRHNIDSDDIDLLEYNGDIIEGSNDAYLALRQLLEENSLANQTIYQQVADQIDIDNFLSYQIAQIYFNNQDWPGNNIKFWKSPTTPWRWILYDTDFGFGMYGEQEYLENTLLHATAEDSRAPANPPWSTLLLRKLLENEQFRAKFITSFADELNTRFEAESVKAHIARLAEVIANEIPAHYLRWGARVGRSETTDLELLAASWEEKLEVMYLFAEQRNEEVREQLVDYFNLEGVAELLVSPIAEGGTLRINNKPVPPQAWQGTYFAGLPITLNAVAEPGFQFSHWSHDNELTSATLEITLQAEEALTLTPIFVSETQQ